MAGEFEESSTHHKDQAPQCGALHDENVDMELPCSSDCDVAGCENKLQLHLVQVEETIMLAGQLGLFATEDIKAGTFVASFGRVRQVKKGGRPEAGYSMAIRETGSGRVVYVTPCVQKVGPYNYAHFINHTCSENHVNVEFIHTGEIGENVVSVSADEQGCKGEPRAFCLVMGPRIAFVSLTTIRVSVTSVGRLNNHRTRLLQLS